MRCPVWLCCLEGLSRPPVVVVGSVWGVRCPVWLCWSEGLSRPPIVVVGCLEGLSRPSVVVVGCLEGLSRPSVVVVGFLEGLSRPPVVVVGSVWGVRCPVWLCWLEGLSRPSVVVVGFLEGLSRPPVVVVGSVWGVRCPVWLCWLEGLSRPPVVVVGCLWWKGCEMPRVVELVMVELVLVELVLVELVLVDLVLVELVLVGLVLVELELVELVLVDLVLVELGEEVGGGRDVAGACCVVGLAFVWRGCVEGRPFPASLARPRLSPSAPSSGLARFDLVVATGVRIAPYLSAKKLVPARDAWFEAARSRAPGKWKWREAEFFAQELSHPLRLAVDQLPEGVPHGVVERCI